MDLYWWKSGGSLPLLNLTISYFIHPNLQIFLRITQRKSVYESAAAFEDSFTRTHSQITRRTGKTRYFFRSHNISQLLQIFSYSISYQWLYHTVYVLVYLATRKLQRLIILSDAPDRFLSAVAAPQASTPHLT